MLSDASYMFMIYTYLGSASLFLLCLAWWLLRHWRAGWVVLVVLLGAALLLTPSYTGPEASTLAPALIVGLFQTFTEGVEAAHYAWKPLMMTSSLALGLSLLLGLTVFRRGRKPAQPRHSEPAAEAE